MPRIDGRILELLSQDVIPVCRGRGVGRVLDETAIREGKSADYRAMRLDTIEPLTSSAVAMYRSLGFRDIAPNRVNPIPGARYMELLLR